VIEDVVGKDPAKENRCPREIRKGLAERRGRQETDGRAGKGTVENERSHADYQIGAKGHPLGCGGKQRGDHGPQKGKRNKKGWEVQWTTRGLECSCLKTHDRRIKRLKTDEGGDNTGP